MPLNLWKIYDISKILKKHTYFPAFSFSKLGVNFRPIKSNKSKIYMTSFVATIDIVLPDLPALSVLPERCINIFYLGGKSYYKT